MKKVLSIVLALMCLTTVFVYRVKLKNSLLSLAKPKLPPAQQVSNYKTTDKVPKLANLDIPFASQAPFADWNMPYQEACEEATAIMTHWYFTGEALTPKIMDKEILKLVDWENKTFGYYKDTTAEEIARIMREYFGHKDVTVKYDFTIDDIKKALSEGHPVILPAAGKLLGNPNFRNGGPVYHALVIKGYTKDKIITNDPGTRNGADYLYDPKVLMNAAHDWNAKNILEGRRAIIVVEN